jgi:hypothetical protein
MFSVPFADQGDRIVDQFAARLGALHGLDPRGPGDPTIVTHARDPV